MKQRLLILAGMGLLAATASAQLTPISARELLPNALAQAQSSLGADAYLQNIFFISMVQSGLTVTLDPATGLATAWAYRYRSPGKDSVIYLLGFKFLGIPTVIPPPAGTAIPDPPITNGLALVDPWVDSPAACSAAMSAGASAFLLAHPSAILDLAMLVDNPADLPLLTKGKYWVFHFLDGADELYCVVDAVTGLSVRCGTITSLQGIPAAEGLRLDEPYPLPLSGTATLVVPLALAAPADLRCEMHDALGRRVALLHDGPLGAGEHLFQLSRAAFPASGIYYLLLRSPAGMRVRHIVVQ
jgi:hypothetical protein